MTQHFTDIIFGVQKGENPHQPKQSRPGTKEKTSVAKAMAGEAGPTKTGTFFLNKNA